MSFSGSFSFKKVDSRILGQSYLSLGFYIVNKIILLLTALSKIL
jgi:hypothetical protein